MEPLLVRTWNVFHGNTVPAERRDHLTEMVRLVSEDRPDIVCLQEVPVWAVERLAEWSGMQAFAEVGALPRMGPFPSTAGIGRALTSLHHGVLRSAFAGQANAILVAPGLRPLRADACVLNPRWFRDRQARWLDLPLVARLAWARERRVCHAVRLAGSDGTLTVANLHATSFSADRRLADAELLRAAVFVDSVARPDDVSVFAGDFNIRSAVSRTLADLTSPEWGYAGDAPGIDHVLVRGAPSARATRWPDGRRSVNGRLLSDHAPLEVRIG
jgi:endonuclease/exonuclease/phosphatase family metal-dependent hydrolase